MKIVLLIRALNQGGAQRQIVNLANELGKQDHRVTVCVFYSGELLEADLLKNRVNFVSLNKRSRWDNIRPAYRFFSTLRETKPDILYSFLAGSNILSGIAKIVTHNCKVLWGVRSSDMDLAHYDKFSRLIFGIERKMSFLPDVIIANSYAGKSHLLENGFPAGKIRVIHNGIDTRKFFIDNTKKGTLKERLDFPQNHFIVGMVARIDPKKDHENFIRAAAILVSRRNDINFVVVGQGDHLKIQQLQKLSGSLQVSGRLKFMGSQTEMNTIYNGIDLLCLSSSFGEGFPNVLGEAMACGVPCVATAVGDASLIIGSTGNIVPPQNPNALANAMELMIEKIERDRKGVEKIVADRIQNKFPNDLMVNQTLSLFASVLGK